MKKKVTLIFGGAGFIGKNLVDSLVLNGERIVISVDNLSNGISSHLRDHESKSNFRFIYSDCSNPNGCEQIFSEASSFGPIEDVWHLAANSDIRAGTDNPSVDLRDTFMTTYEIIRALEKYGARRFYFASSSAIYGEGRGLPLTESTGPLLPLSNYGAMKLASEAYISASTQRLGFTAYLLRFPNVVGVPATHGVIFDFCKKLIQNPSVLNVLGNGSQRKCYLHVSDLIDALLSVARNNDAGSIVPLNIGPSDRGVTVKWIAEQVVSYVSPGAKIIYGTEPRGWIGDIPSFNYSIDKILATGWSPKYSSEEAIKRAIGEVADQCALGHSGGGSLRHS